MTIKNKFKLQDTVYITSDPSQREGQVTAIIVVPGAIKYQVQRDENVDTFYDFQLTSEPKPTTNNIGFVVDES